jgi:hypothetical protein
MGIKDKKIKENLDFEYECDFKNAEGSESYEIKFHQTDEYGDTLTLIHPDGESIGYSANMLAEIVDFLRERNLLEGDHPNVVHRTEHAATVRTGLPLPTVTDQENVVANTQKPEYYGIPEVLDVAPMQSFSQQTTGQAVAPAPVPVPSPDSQVVNLPMQGIFDNDPDVGYAPPDQNENRVANAEISEAPVVAETPAELKEDANQMALERANAMAKSQNDPNKKAKLKRRLVTDPEE